MNVSGPLYFVATCPDNGSYWLGDESRARCPECGSKTTRNVAGEDFYLKKKSYDISMTYDGFYIASEAFRQACNAAQIQNRVAFEEIPPDKRYSSKFYRVEVIDQLSVDVALSRPEFGEKCGSCGQFKYVVGAKDYFISPLSSLGAGIWRTDLEFADGVEKFYKIIVGVVTAERLTKASLRGLELRPVRNT